MVCRRGGRERDAGGEGKRDTEGVEEDELELGAASPLSSLILFFASSLTYMSLQPYATYDGTHTPFTTNGVFIHSYSHDAFTPLHLNGNK